jgi:hypothetical protein
LVRGEDPRGLRACKTGMMRCAQLRACHGRDAVRALRACPGTNPSVVRSFGPGRSIIARMFSARRRKSVGKCSLTDRTIDKIERRRPGCIAAPVFELEPAAPPPLAGLFRRSFARLHGAADMCSLTLGTTGRFWRKAGGRTGSASMRMATCRPLLGWACCWIQSPHSSAPRRSDLHLR